MPKPAASWTPPRARTLPEAGEAWKSRDPRPTLDGDSHFRVEAELVTDFSTFENNLPPNINSKETGLRVRNKRLMQKSTGATGSVKIIAHSG